MKLRPDQLDPDLKRRLAPVYLIHGDEPLQAMEAADAVRLAARDAGCSERQILTVEPGFDWRQLAASAANSSLFTHHRLLELRLDDAKPGTDGGRALTTYAANPATDVVLLVLCSKLDGNAQKSRWFSALERAGVAIQVWPLTGRRLSLWLEQRMRGQDLMPGPGVVELLAEQTEGNLLAAAQEIDKLALLHGSGPIDTDQTRAAISDSDRFSVFELTAAALAGQGARVVHIIDHLRLEDTEPALVAWALTREVLLLSQLHVRVGRGSSVPDALAQLRVWDKRKPLLHKTLLRLPAAECQRLLKQCSELDRLIKGLAPGRPWDALLHVALSLAGRPLRIR